MNLMQEQSDPDMDPVQIAEAIKSLTDDEQAVLQRVCGLLLNCFGENATRKAVLVTLEDTTMALYNLNADVQDTMDVLSAAHEAFNDRVIGEIPPKEMMN
jgi:hypothetical protein